MVRPGAGASLRDGLFEISPATVDEIKKLLDVFPVFGREALTAEADYVHSGDQVGASGRAIVGNILAEGTVALDHTVVADAEKLVKDGPAAQKGVVSQMDMARDEGRVGDDVLVPELHIMSQVGPHHDEVAIAHLSEATFLGPAVDGDMLSDDVVSTDADTALDRRRESNVLGEFSDDGGPTDGGAFANHGVTYELGVGGNAAARPDLYWSLDDRVGSDFRTRVNLGFSGNEGGRMDHGQLVCRKRGPKD